jgi:hypothetical protein
MAPTQACVWQQRFPESARWRTSGAVVVAAAVLGPDVQRRWFLDLESQRWFLDLEAWWRRSPARRVSDGGALGWASGDDTPEASGQAATTLPRRVSDDGASLRPSNGDTPCWGPSSFEGPQKHDLTMFPECNT